MRKFSLVLLTLLITIGCLVVVGCGNSPVVEETTTKERAEKNVEGVYVWKSDSSDLVETLILKPDGVQTLKNNQGTVPGRQEDGTYKVEGNKVKAEWGHSGWETYTIVGDDLVGDESDDVWVKQ